MECEIFTPPRMRFLDAKTYFIYRDLQRVRTQCSRLTAIAFIWIWNTDKSVSMFPKAQKTLEKAKSSKFDTDNVSSYRSAGAMLAPDYQPR